MCVKMASALSILRQTAHEIRQMVPGPNFRDHDGVRYLLRQFRQNKVTDQQLCKAQEEMKFLTHTYLCYLRSLRRYHEINRAYRGRGERTIDQTAKIVGFKLPHDPK